MDEFFMFGIDCLALLLYRIWKVCRPRIHFLVANLVLYWMNQMVTYFACDFETIDLVRHESIHIYIVEPLYSGHNWFSEKVSAIKRCIHYKACTILLHQVKSIWSKLTLIWYGMIWYWQSCDSISTFKRSIIVLFNLDYHVGLSFLCFHWYKISQLCNKSW